MFLVACGCAVLAVMTYAALASRRFTPKSVANAADTPVEFIASVPEGPHRAPAIDHP